MNNEEKQNSSKGTQQAVPPYAYYPQTISVEEDKINLVDYWWILMERKKLIVLITLLFTITSIVVALLMTPIYRAEVLLAPMGGEGSGGAASALGQFGGLASMVGIDLGSNSTEHTLAVLTSRRFLEVFFKKKKRYCLFCFPIYGMILPVSGFLKKVRSRLQCGAPIKSLVNQF